jgi:threonylcarbamoyladenosine tRNA methylthiotransferase MtaB
MPLQSADNRILSAMRRGHTIKEYSDLVESALKANPDAALGTDLMVGFPGEDNEAFLHTLQFVSSGHFAYLHIFTFSPRRSTPAFGMPGRPSGHDVKERMRMLKAVDYARREAFRGAFFGKILPFLIESPEHPSGGFCALSHNYLRVRLRRLPEGARPGQVVPLELDTSIDMEIHVP